MRVAGVQFFLILFFQVCFAANALDLSPRSMAEDTIITATWSQNQNPVPLEQESDEQSPLPQAQETTEDDDFEIWHASSFLLSSFNLISYSCKIEKIHLGPYLSGLFRPPWFA